MNMPSEIESMLTEKGPGRIPVWAYGVGVAGAFLAFEWFRNKNPANAAAQNTPQAPPAPGTTTVTKTTDSGGGWGSPWPWMPFYKFGPPSPPGITTNTEWRHLAADWLESKGYRDGEVNDILADYLDGQKLSREESRIKDLAIDEWGSPPEGITGSTNNGHFVGPPPPESGAQGSDTSVNGPGVARNDVRVNVRGEQRTRERRRRERR